MIENELLQKLSNKILELQRRIEFLEKREVGKKYIDNLSIENTIKSLRKKAKSKVTN